MTDRTDIVVVGAGVAGLVAGASAAVAGQGVTVLDAHPIGGRARSTAQQGFTLNLGAHALYRKGAFARELARLGVGVAGRSPAVDKGYVVKGGELHRLPIGAASLMTTSALKGRSRVAAATMFARLPKLEPATLRGRTVGQWLADTPDDVRAIVEVFLRLSSYTDAPDLFDAGAALTQFQLALGGVTYVDGGWQTLVESLRDVVVANGGVVAESSEVVGIHHDGDDVIVSTRDRSTVADAVVLATGGPATAARLTGRAVPGIERLGPPVEASVLDLGMPQSAGPVGPIVLGADRPMYLSVHAPVAALAPEGRTLVAVMEYLRPGHPARPPGETRQRLVEHAEVAGIHRGDLELDRFLRSAVVHHGVPLASSGGLHGRPPVDALGGGDLAGVFLAGDWVGGEGMLSDASAASGALAGQMAARHSARIHA